MYVYHANLGHIVGKKYGDSFGCSHGWCKKQRLATAYARSSGSESSQKKRGNGGTKGVMLRTHRQSLLPRKPCQTESTLIKVSVEMPAHSISDFCGLRFVHVA